MQPKIAVDDDYEFEENVSMTPPRILVMDDDDQLRSLYTRALRKAGYEVYPAATLQEARDLIKAYHFEIMLCDIQMGQDERGTDLLREQNTALSQGHTQIIMSSAEVQYRALCEEMGAEFFLEKPIAIRPLVTLVHRLTRHHTR